MNDSVLSALLASLERREDVAMLTVTEASGQFASAEGKHCVLWSDKERAPVGDLGLGALMDSVAYDARRALDEREHRHLEYEQPEGRVKIVVEVQAQPPRLISVGAGHIAVPLAALAAPCHVALPVLDDRRQYAHPDRFPTAKSVIAGPFREELGKLRDAGALDSHTYIVLV